MTCAISATPVYTSTLLQRPNLSGLITFSTFMGFHALVRVFNLVDHLRHCEGALWTKVKQLVHQHCSPPTSTVQLLGPEPVALLVRVQRLLSCCRTFPKSLIHSLRCNPNVLKTALSSNGALPSRFFNPLVLLYRKYLGDRAKSVLVLLDEQIRLCDDVRTARRDRLVPHCHFLDALEQTVLPQSSTTPCH